MPKIDGILKQLEKQKKAAQKEVKRIGQAIAALRGAFKLTRSAAARPRRKLSASARRRIAEAQRKRWARVKAASKSAKPSAGAKE